ncbi:sn-glycerol-3-phosphate ABC transporter ATP-binding protein UgpC [candidate division KSB1 bacterium]|nr:sn-glycerol-3-phosphate ABC transporter ATP-binding protein UgpC [candidate division KSB1 bacterium]
MANVVLKEVCKTYDNDITAVSNVNIEVKDKEFIVLVGPSGCGKSTTLRLIAGLEEVTSGELYIGDKLINKVHPKDRNIAMVFQNYALYPHMTVFKNMAFGLKLRKVSKTEIQRRVKEAADILGISELLERTPKALSGGQKQRVAVGRAIVRNPQVFLFDEPLSNLDAKLRVKMRTEISKLYNRLNTTMIYVTHDQVEAMTLGNRIVVMKDGIIHQIDTPLNLYNFPKNEFVAGFIGSPAMNFFSGKISRENGIWFHEETLRLKIPQKFENKLADYFDKEITFGIRPEDIYESSTSNNLKDKSEVKLMVEVVEPMGSETYLYFTTRSNTLVAKIRTQNIPSVGQKVDLVFNMAKAHFFDKETEESIRI